MSLDLKESLVSLEKLVNHISKEAHDINEAPSFDVVNNNTESGKLHGYTVPVEDDRGRQNILTVSGDVTSKDGPINHIGDVVIKGNVEAGSVVRASGNIIIEGTVANASVNAGGTIAVTQGIYGGDFGKIVANGNVTAGFMEKAEVVSGGSVKTNYILDSIISSDGYVIANGKNSFISGGKVHGLLGIETTEIGNEMEEPTVVMAGYSSEEYSRYLEKLDKENELSEHLSDAVNEITKIVRRIRRGETTMPEVSDELESLNGDKDFFFHELDNIRFDIKQVESKLKAGKGSMVCVSETIYPGTILEIEGAAFRVPAKTSYLKYACEGNKIVSKVFG